MRNQKIRDVVPVCTLGGMRISCLSRMDTVYLMKDVISGRYPDFDAPLFMTSSNGQVLAKYASSKHVQDLYDQADIISADGQPMVTLSKILAKNPVADRSCTTDLFHDASITLDPGTKYFLLGASKEEISVAANKFRKLYPKIDLVGYSDGYLTEEREAQLIEELDRLKPDILWIGMGVPRQQDFVVRNLRRLSSVKIIKTAGGLFNYVSGTRSRAPLWMRNFGMEWIYRLMLEPKRLIWRYCVSNPYSLFLLLTRTR